MKHQVLGLVHDQYVDVSQFLKIPRASMAWSHSWERTACRAAVTDMDTPRSDHDALAMREVGIRRAVSADVSRTPLDGTASAAVPFPSAWSRVTMTTCAPAPVTAIALGLDPEPP